MEEKKLTAEQYWKWRTYIAEMQLSQREAKLAEHVGQKLIYDIELLKLRVALHNHQIEALNGKAQIAKTDYDQLKLELENTLNMSLNGCVIDDLDYSVKKLEE